MNNNKKIVLGSFMVVIVVLLIMVVVFAFEKKGDSPIKGKEVNISGENKEMNDGINIVTSLEDELSNDTAWCGTFNLIWNDLKNDLAKQDIVFAEQSYAVKNLNKETFTVAELDDKSYYKVYGIPSLALKEQIENAIKEKFNETSDILDDFDWENVAEKDYFLYCMLKKEFKFPKVFTKLENGSFGNGSYDNIKYFGINGTTDETVRNQVKVLYYNSENNFAIKLETEDNDEVIIAVGEEENSFLEIYNSILAKQEEYDGSSYFKADDRLKVPYITFDLKQNITEVENKEFYFSNGEPYIISTALQTIKFELDEKGGKIKSEAGMMVENTSIAFDEVRYFNVDTAFTMFLKEEGKDLPYFATKITDISKVQKLEEN